MINMVIILGAMTLLMVFHFELRSIKCKRTNKCYYNIYGQKSRALVLACFVFVF